MHNRNTLKRPTTTNNRQFSGRLNRDRQEVKSEIEITPTVIKPGPFAVYLAEYMERSREYVAYRKATGINHPDLRLSTVAKGRVTVKDIDKAIASINRKHEQLALFVLHKRLTGLLGYHLASEELHEIPEILEFSESQAAEWKLAYRRRLDRIDANPSELSDPWFLEKGLVQN